MPLIVTPGRLSRFAEFYNQLAAMLTAGMPLVQALDQLHRSPPNPFFRRPLRRLLDDLAQGMTLTEGLQHLRGWLPSFDLALIAAGEQSGRLDASFRLLSEYYQERASLVRNVLGSLAYPVFLGHFAILIIPFAGAFLSGDWGGYARLTLGVLLPIYAVVFLLVYAAQGKHGEFWRALVERAFAWVPILGGARRHLSLARLAAALEALLNAGVPVTEAWSLASAASGSPSIRRAVGQWHPRLHSGDSPGDCLPATKEFPSMFANMYSTGEISGTLDDSLKRLHAYYQDSATRRLRALAEWLPRIVYIGIVIYLALYVVRFWVNYYDRILGS